MIDWENFTIHLYFYFYPYSKLSCYRSFNKETCTQTSTNSSITVSQPWPQPHLMSIMCQYIANSPFCCICTTSPSSVICLPVQCNYMAHVVLSYNIKGEKLIITWKIRNFDWSSCAHNVIFNDTKNNTHISEIYFLSYNWLECRTENINYEGVFLFVSFVKVKSKGIGFVASVLWALCCF